MWKIFLKVGDFFYFVADRFHSVAADLYERKNHV